MKPLPKPTATKALQIKGVEGVGDLWDLSGKVWPTDAQSAHAPRGSVAAPIYSV